MSESHHSEASHSAGAPVAPAAEAALANAKSAVSNALSASQSSPAKVLDQQKTSDLPASNSNVNGTTPKLQNLYSAAAAAAAASASASAPQNFYPNGPQAATQGGSTTKPYNSNKSYGPRHNQHPHQHPHSQQSASFGPGNNRQHNNNNNNYNNRKSAGQYNQLKAAANANAGGSQGGLGGAGQYNNYAAHGQYPQNMYYGYYGNPYGNPYSYTMVPNMPPVQAYQQAQALLLLPQAKSPVPGFVPMSGSKVIITDKEGKQIDLDEKKRLSSSATPISSPVPSLASINTAGSPAATTPAAASSKVASTLAAVPAKEASTSASASASPVIPTASTANSSAPVAGASDAKLSIAEEFKRRIRERAAAAALSKPKEEPKVESKPEIKTEPKAEAKPEPVVDSKPESKEIKLESKPVSAPASAPVSAPVTAPVSVPVSVPVPQKAESEAEPKTEQSAPKSEPVADETCKEPETATETSVITPGITSQHSQSGSEPNADVSVEKLGENDPESKESKQQESESVEDANKEDEEEKEEEEPTFTLSNFLTRTSEASPIDDPFAITYPEPLQGPDARWKIEGRKYRYDPGFLMQFQEVCNVPVDSEWKIKLESLGITGNKRQASQSGRSGMGGGKFGSSSNLSRFGNGSMRGGQFDGRQNSRSGSKRKGGSSGGPRDKSTRKGNQSKRGGRERERDEQQPSKPKEDVKPLEKSENRWIPRSRQKKEDAPTNPDGSVSLNEEDIERKVKSLLNKLTLEMFEPITDDIMKIADQSKWEDNAKTVRQVISLTFAKACDEPYWSAVYAQFCAKMCKQMSTDIKDVNMIDRNGEVSTGGDLARRILLSTCQEEYEKGWTDKLPTNEDGTPLEPEMMSDEYYIMAAAKRRGLGLVKFIGHLYILNMLNDQVILICLKDQSSNTEDPSEDRLESLSQLIKTVGARLETKEKTKAALNYVFDNVETILENVKLSSRIKFMLMDLIDLRNDHWVSAKSESGPKTIQEIHDEAELQKYEEERAAAEKRRKNKGNDSRSNSSRGGGSSWGSSSNKGLLKDLRAPPQKDSRGFTAVSRSQSNRPSAAASEPSSTNLARDNLKRSDSVQSAVNMFAALGDDEGHGEDDEDEEEEHGDEAGHAQTESTEPEAASEVVEST